MASGLARFGYAVNGWASTPRLLDGVRVFGGDASCADFLANTDVLVCLLPLTPLTAGILNARTLAALRRDAALIHCGRGAHLVEADLLAALDSGHLRGAVLDVFSKEPLPPSSALWTHPRVVVTPHMATIPTFRVAVQQVVRNIKRVRAGEAPANAIDPARGY